MAADLLMGEGQDAEGNPLRFEEVQGAIFPTYQAMKPMSDGSGRVQVFSFGLQDTKVRVSVTQQSKEEFVELAKKELARATEIAEHSIRTEKAFKTVSAVKKSK